MLFGAAAPQWGPVVLPLQQQPLGQGLIQLLFGYEGDTVPFLRSFVPRLMEAVLGAALAVVGTVERPRAETRNSAAAYRELQDVCESVHHTIF